MLSGGSARREDLGGAWAGLQVALAHARTARGEGNELGGESEALFTTARVRRPNLSLLQPRFSSKVLLAHSHIPTFPPCLWLLGSGSLRAEQFLQAPSGQQSRKDLPADPVQKASANPCTRIAGPKSRASGLLEQCCLPRAGRTPSTWQALLSVWGDEMEGSGAGLV